METSGGVVAGRFAKDGTPSDGDRGALIKAFDDASAAAKSASESYRKAGNAASADYYAKKAEKLAEQME